MNINDYKLPRSAIRVLSTLEEKGAMTVKELCKEIDLAPRTISFALKKLLMMKLCNKRPNLADMRQPHYRPIVSIA